MMRELGFALKRGRYKDVWRGRYFVFDEERCVLKYWESESDFKNFVSPRGELTIYGVAALEVGEKLYCISLQIGSLEEWLALHSLEERDRWIEVLRNCVTKQKKRKEEWFEPDDSLWDDVLKHPPWGYSGSSSAIEKKQVLSSTELKKLDRASVFDYSAVRSGWRVEVRYHIQAFASGLPEPWTSRISHAQLRQFLMVELGRQDLVVLLDKRHAAANPKRLLSPALLGRRVELMNIVLERLVQEHSQELLDWLLQQQGESTHNDWTTTSYNALRAAAVWTKTYNNKAAAHDEKGQSESEFDTDEIISNISEDMTTKSICNKSYQKDVFLQTLQQALLTANPRYCCAGLAILVLAISIEPRMNSPAILFLAAVLGAALGAKIVHDPTGHEIRQTEDYDIVHRVQKNISLPRWPSGDGRHCFSEPDAGFFRIRGPTYLEDKLKIASKPALFPLAGVDLFLTDVPQQHVARHPAALVQRHSKLNSPRILVVNFCMPWGNLVGYWSLVSSHTNKKKKQMLSSDDHQCVDNNDTADDKEDPENKAALDLFERFIDADDEYRDARLKLVPRVVDGGSWIVRRAVGAGVHAAKLSEAVKLAYYSDPDYFEIDVDIVGSPLARRILSVVKSATSTLVMDLALVIEATDHAQLPERILGAVRLHRVNPEQAPTLTPFHHTSDDDVVS